MSAEHRNECTLESCSGSHDGLRPLRSTPADDRGASSPGQRPQQNAATISSPNTIFVHGNGLVSNETKVYGAVSGALIRTLRPMCFLKSITSLVWAAEAFVAPALVQWR